MVEQGDVGSWNTCNKIQGLVSIWNIIEQISRIFKWHMVDIMLELCKLQAVLVVFTPKLIAGLVLIFGLIGK